MENKITTIKLSKETKERLDHLKEYRRETYDEILEKMFEILNICKLNPEAARHKLLSIDKKRKVGTKKEQKKQGRAGQTNTSNAVK